MESNDNIFSIGRMVKIIPYLTIAVLTLICFSQCTENKRVVNNYNALQSQFSTYKLKNGKTVATANASQFTVEELENAVIDKDAQIKDLYRQFAKPKTITKEVVRTVFDTIKIVYKDTVPCVFNKTDSIKHKWYKFDYTSTQKGVDINKLSIQDTVRCITGIKRKWFLGKETHTIDIMHSNPYVKTEGLQHIEVSQKKKFWQTTGFQFGVGLLTGYYITK